MPDMEKVKTLTSILERSGLDVREAVARNITTLTDMRAISMKKR